MSSDTTKLQVLLVEDESDDLRQYVRDFPSVFSSRQVEADIHPCGSFDDAFARISNPLYRYDLIVSDTYNGPPRNQDAQVIRMVDNYQGTRFCPLVIYSSSVKPHELEETAFIVWADKGKSGDIERAINQLLDTNIPQLARKLHNELERSAGSYLWEFLEKRWDDLIGEKVDAAVLERLIRRRAALQIGRLNPLVEGTQELEEVRASEFYIYPSISEDSRLGEIIKSVEDETFRVVLTPHCHLRIQPDETAPRAEHVLTVKAFPAKETILNAYKKPDGTQKNPWQGNKAEKLQRRIQSPAGSMGMDGRYWFMPGFLDIPDSYCDLLQLESIAYQEISDTGKFKRVAAIDAPFAEALQSCFTGFYLRVGIPNLNSDDFKHLIDDVETA
ncbi:MAG: hypothetical protein KAV87_34995 [Desulfobacteraceae bacterium]|nr:hypothetical protein [Desulfobacteraceae bacterium]